ncbi:MAG: sulfite exporter TauE/SafE family protein [Bacteroidetes bacterium]|nr:sulfite exporter TauE/SafE family protein [Bacteroidota bacterium]MDA1336648.1 sulfite exporter TauE/SafE family protein [Bacteroidota bacterium]
MEILGYAMALVIGVSLGLIGGGGSILAVPVLAYLFALDEKIATAYSLFVVGSAALVGGLRQHSNQNVDWRTAIVFGIPAIIGVWLVRHFVVPALPDVLIHAGEFAFTRRMGMFGLFSILMVWAAWSMLSSKERKSGSGEVKYNYSLILFEGLLVGGITGLVGAGGGFLIIPALVILANLEIKKAIGTSLMIIALKSLMGFFLGDALTTQIDWPFLLQFTAIAIAGIFGGVYIGNFIDGKKLKKGFGYFIIAMAFFIFTMEFII